MVRVDLGVASQGWIEGKRGVVQNNVISSSHIEFIRYLQIQISYDIYLTPKYLTSEEILKRFRMDGDSGNTIQLQFFDSITQTTLTQALIGHGNGRVMYLMGKN